MLCKKITNNDELIYNPISGRYILNVWSYCKAYKSLLK